MATNPFAKAHWQKIELNKKTAKKIKRAYSTTAKDVKDRLARLKAAGPGNMSYATYSAKKLYLEGLLKDLNNSLDNLERTVQVTLLGAAEESGFIAIKATENMLKEIGLDMKGAFSYVPRQEVANILSGKLYGSDWNFSKAIWGMEKKTKDDLEKIVARGLAENKPIYDIAKDLEKYVDPSARKPWDWSKVYPGTTKTVDYNAQRLARTMIQHSYQTSMVQAQKDNPFCKGIIWHSVGLHGRTCEQCLERDGQVFPVKDLPLDHPNGLCYFEPALDDMNDIADRLADWTMGKDDLAIDNYVSSAFGMNPGTPLAKQKIGEVKDQASSKASALTGSKGSAVSAPMNKEAFVDKNFTNLKARVLEHSDADGEDIWKALRAKMITLEEDQLKYMATGQDSLKSILLDSQSAFYTPWRKSISMDLYKDMMNSHGKGAFTTFFHEYGHHLDHIAGTFTDDEKFCKSLYKKLRLEYNKLCNNGMLLHSVRQDLVTTNASNGVQDIISGLSLNKNRVLWGHSTKYWKNKGKQNGVVLETMAHFNAAWANPTSEAYMKKYFPESYQLIKDQVMRYMKTKGV